MYFYAFFNETYPMKPTQNHKPQMFDPTAKMPPVDTASNADANLLHQSTVTLEGMPKVSELQKLQSDNRTARKPFQWQFLLPQYWGIWLGVALILPLIYLPLRYQFKIGHFLGKLLFGLIKSRRADTLTNLSLAFPELSEDQRLEMAEKIFINAGVGVFESLCAWYRPDVFTRCVTVSGLHHVKNAQSQGKAVILLGIHSTLLDLGGRLTTIFTPLDVVYRPQNNALLDWFIFNARSKVYSDQISHRDMRHFAKNLKDNHVVWITPDQDFGLKQGVMADFFGVPAATLTAPRRMAKLGNKANPPAVMILHFYRETPDEMPKGRKPHYHIIFSPVIDNYPTEDELADANRINQLLENYIRIDPTQYMWFHRRYKTQPTGIRYYR